MNDLRQINKMGKNARKVYEEKFTAERNYEMLIQIYQEVIKSRTKVNESTGSNNSLNGGCRNFV